MTISISDIDVFIGIDVGKAEHWATALDSAGKTLFDKVLPNNESRLRDLYKRLGEHGRLLVVVDQPATIGAPGAWRLPETRASRWATCRGVSMRRIADLTPGSARTDRRDAAVIAQAARTMPHTLRDVTAADEEAASLTMPAGSGPGPGAPGRPRPRAASGACTPRPRPALEAVLGPHLARDAVLEAIAAWPTPTALRKAGKARIDARLKKHGARRHAAWAQQVCEALKKQTVTVAGTDAAGAVLPHLAHPAHLPARSEGRAPRPGPGPWRAAHPSPARSPPPVPGTGVPAAAVFLAETLGRTPATGAQLASYAGLAPVTRRSGSSIRGERRLPRRQQAAQDSHARLRLRLPALRPRQPRLLPAQTRPGKRPGQAATALAHRRVLTLHAMIRNGTLYDPQPAAQLPTAA